MTSPPVGDRSFRDRIPLIKVFESFDLVEAGRVRSLLEAHGIETFLKNEFLSGALGELPFQEVAPQVWVVHDRDLPRALELMQQEAQPQAPDDGDD